MLLCSIAKVEGLKITLNFNDIHMLNYYYKYVCTHNKAIIVVQQYTHRT